MEQCSKSVEEVQELFTNFVTVVESILSSNPECVSHVSGAFDRSQNSLLPILLHGIRSSQKLNQLWEFILGLRVMKESLWPSELINLPDQDSASLISLWMNFSFKEQKISLQIQTLVSDRENLEKCYQEGAFLRSEMCTSALITALCAFDQISLDTFAKINMKMMSQFLEKKSLSADIRYDLCRSSSQLFESTVMNSSSFIKVDTLPRGSLSDNELIPIPLMVCYDEVLGDTDNTNRKEDSRDGISQRSDRKTKNIEDQPLPVVGPKSNYLYDADIYKDESCPSSDHGFNSLYKNITENWLLKPPPVILKHLTKSSRRFPVNLEKYKISVNEKVVLGKKMNEAKECLHPGNGSRLSHIRSHSDGIKFLKRLSEPLSCSEVGQMPPYSSDMSFSIGSGKRFMEDGGHSIETGAYGYFPRPRPGQHLFDFLYDCYTATTNAQLDRENAHFSIAEAVIGAIEQMNYDAISKDVPNYTCDDSEDISSHLPIKRLRQKNIRNKPQYQVASSDEPVSSDHSQSSSDNTDDTNEGEGAGELIPSEELETFGKKTDENLSDRSTSAENVAISLLLKYNSNLLPKAIDLQWRFSEEEDMTKKLGLQSGNITSEDRFEFIGNASIRGTADWAPPRPQLVLTIHKKSNKISCIGAQNYQCAGCGLKVCQKKSYYFRFCTYLGKYFCTSCHSNKKSIIPASVIFNWDFNKYVVSNFSNELLLRMQSDPLFNVTSLNVGLYKQCQCLNQCQVYRLQLCHARKYIISCRNAEKEKELLNSVPIHWSTDPHVYSIDDLLAIKSNTFLEQMMNLTSVLVKHISSCQVCLGQGFVCEMCKNGSPIFPFQLDAVTQCLKCEACYHVQCFLPDTTCLRCVRRFRKKEQIQQEES